MRLLLLLLILKREIPAKKSDQSGKKHKRREYVNNQFVTSRKVLFSQIVKNLRPLHATVTYNKHQATKAIDKQHV